MYAQSGWGSVEKASNSGHVTSGGGIARFEAAARTQTYEAGLNVYKQGDEFNGIYRLESGLVGLRKLNENGSTILVGLVRRGDFIGYGPLLNGNGHRTSAEVLQSSRLSFLDAPRTRALVGEEPILLTILLQQTTRELSLLEHKHLQILTKLAHERLAALLVLLSAESPGDSSGPGCAFEVPIRNRDMADLLGIRPETLSRAIGWLRSHGIAIIKGRKVRIPNRSDLIQVADCSADGARLRQRPTAPRYR